MSSIPVPEHAASAPYFVRAWRMGKEQHQHEQLAEEVPVALEYNGISHAVMLASPQDLEDFALGFSLSEGILASPSELYDCETTPLVDGIRVEMEIASERFVSLKEKRRNLTGRTGCGLCGAETLEQAVRRPAPVHSAVRFTASALHAGLQAMQGLQTLQQRTGATHAAAWMEADGSVTLVREDVGRHNALDKLIGALSLRGADFSSGAALITSRASYEMVQKAATLGIGMLVAVSAPTGLAVRLAEQTNVTLLGFVRNSNHVVYTHPERVLREPG